MPTIISLLAEHMRRESRANRNRYYGQGNCFKSKVKSGPIILVEDDEDDKDIFAEAICELRILNKLIWFINTELAFHYLKTTPDQPFLIVCDINLPGQNGLDFKRQLDKDKELRRKSIPFVFLSTGVSQKVVNDAYLNMTIQGFFKKRNTYEQVRDEIKMIFDYWQVCFHPNTSS